MTSLQQIQHNFNSSIVSCNMGLSDFERELAENSAKSKSSSKKRDRSRSRDRHHNVHSLKHNRPIGYGTASDSFSSIAAVKDTTASTPCATTSVAIKIRKNPIQSADGQNITEARSQILTSVHTESGKRN